MASHAKKKIPGKQRGGKRPGAGRKDILSEAVGTYNSLKTLRLESDAPQDLRDLVGECRQQMLNIMRKPTRHAQTQLMAARLLIEEACGKPTEHVKNEGVVTVEIKQSFRPTNMPGLPAEKVIEGPALPPGTKE